MEMVCVRNLRLVGIFRTVAGFAIFRRFRVKGVQTAYGAGQLSPTYSDCLASSRN
jgi:hypothetical protein